MNPVEPASYLEIAEKVVKSWGQRKVSFILVSPPLTDSGSVFKILRDQYFQESNGVDPSNVSIAYLPQSKYRTPKEFVQRVLAEWGVGEVSSEFEAGFELDELEAAASLLYESGRTPVILLPQFHKAVEKLSSDLGYKLREMEADYDLQTVIELPIPLEKFYERWNQLEDKDSFICSGFGQGHRSILLEGYKNSEMLDLARQSHVPEQYQKEIVYWSGGIPALFEMMLAEARSSKSLYQFGNFVQNDLLPECDRFLKWLDFPGEDTFRDGIARIWQGDPSAADLAMVGEHDWRRLLLGKEGTLSSAAIGAACTRSMGGSYEETIFSIETAVNRGNGFQVDALVASLTEAYSTQEQLRCILSVLPVWKIAQGHSPDWKSIKSTAQREKSKLRNCNSERGISTKDVLEKWHSFACGMLFFIRSFEGGKEDHWRLTDVLSGRNKRKGDSGVAAVQLVLYRLYEARKIEDPTVALKSVLEIPDQILQIYCGRVLNIDIWSAPEFDSAVVAGARTAWTRGEYRVPKPDAILEFNDLLYIGWVYMQDIHEKKRLFDSIEDVDYWSLWYETMRNTPSHSITFVTKDEWVGFSQRCLELAEKLSISLVEQCSYDVLPKLDVFIAKLGGSEVEQEDRS